jgi:hypothetical protein
MLLIFLDPVLFCNDLAADDASHHTAVPSNGKSTLSVKEAVSIARNNNFMGLICRSRLLVSRHSIFLILSQKLTMLDTGTKTDRVRQDCWLSPHIRYLWITSRRRRFSDRPGTFGVAGED